MEDVDVFSHVLSCVDAGVVHFRTDEREMVCPSCGDDENHFSVNVKKGLYNCYKCQLKGSLLRVISQNRQKWLSAVGTPHERYRPGPSLAFPLCGTPISQVDRGGVPRHKKGEPIVMAALSAKEYCLRRGMTNEQIDTYKVSVKEYDPRVYFPYWDQGGDLTFWMGRATNDAVEPKTLEPPNTSKPLYGRHVSHIAGGLVVLVEGVFDHFVTPCSYALMGSGITGTQIAVLRLDGVKRVALIQDPDAGEAAMVNARKLSRFGIDARVCLIQSSRDPAEIGREQMTGVVDWLESQPHRIAPRITHLNV